MSGIVWLASYPKSGNTWCRLFFLFLTRQINDGDINRIGDIPACYSQALFERALGLDLADLTLKESCRLRPKLHEWYCNSQNQKPLMLKIHDAHFFFDDDRQKPLVAPDVTRGVIYIIRNPLDVVVSVADFFSISIERSVERLCDDRSDMGMAYDRPMRHPVQIIRSWSQHVVSWVDTSGLRVHVMKYEDMQSRPKQSFLQAARFAGIDCESNDVNRAVNLCDFNRLKKLESKMGFIENRQVGVNFFNQGRVGRWRELLSRRQVHRIITEHREVMVRFGYIDGDNRLIDS